MVLENEGMFAQENTRKQARGQLLKLSCQCESINLQMNSAESSPELQAVSTVFGTCCGVPDVCWPGRPPLAAVDVTAADDGDTVDFMSTRCVYCCSEGPGSLVTAVQLGEAGMCRSLNI